MQGGLVASLLLSCSEAMTYFVRFVCSLCSLVWALLVSSFDTTTFVSDLHENWHTTLFGIYYCVEVVRFEKNCHIYARNYVLSYDFKSF